MYPNIPGPCNCPSLIVDPGPVETPCTDCLFVVPPKVFCIDGPSAYNQTRQLSVTVLNCTDWTGQVTKAPLAFKQDSVGFNGDNNIQFTTDPIYAAPAAGEKLNINFRIICNSGPLAGYSVNSVAQICIKNMCAQVSCASGYVCDPETGLCVVSPGELSISGGLSGPVNGGLSLS